MKTKAELQRVCIGARHEAADEISLPDYMPEIGRIISCSSAILPDSRYIDRGELVLSGLVIVCVYYIGDNGELCAYPHNCEYSVQLSCAGCDMTGLSVERLIVNTSAESTLCRATGPRRLSLTLKLHSAVFAAQHDETELELVSGETAGGTANSESTLELYRFPTEYTSLYCGASSGNLSGELHIRESSRIISCEGAAAVTSATVAGGRATVKGELYISCLAADAEGRYFTARTRAPFEENVALGELPSDATRTYAVGRARCAAVKLHGGEDGALAWEAEYDVEATAFAEQRTELIGDAYSTEYFDSCELSSARVVRCLSGVNTQLSANASRQLPTAGGGEISHITATVSSSRAECTAEGRLVLSGSCAVTALMASGGETVLQELDVPYRFECECKRGEATAVMAGAEVICAEGRLDGDRLSVSCELALTCIALECAEKRYVSRVVLKRDEPVTPRRELLTLYYPSNGESSWEIGKKYHCPQSCIKALDGTAAVMISTK